MILNRGRARRRTAVAVLRIQMRTTAFPPLGAAVTYTRARAVYAEFSRSLYSFGDGDGGAFLSHDYLLSVVCGVVTFSDANIEAILPFLAV